MNNYSKKWWWLITLRGIFVTIFGIVALFATELAAVGIALYFGVFMIFGGLSLVWSAFTTRKVFDNWKLWLIEGIIDILFGIVVIILPSLTIKVVMIFIALWALAMGIMQLLDAYRIKTHTGLRIFNGIMMLVFGGLLLFNPLAGAIAITILIGIFAIVFGLMNIVLSFKIKDLEESYPDT